jgi:outer membrane biogenesis lipoprotein LolB
MKFIYAVLGLTLVLSGCAGQKLPLPPAPEAKILLQRLSDNGPAWRQLDAAAKVGLERQGKFLSAQEFLLLEKPINLRVDVLTVFNQLALQLAVDQGQLQVFLNTQVPGRYYRGPVSDELLARFTGLPLGIETLVRLLLYDPPVGEYQTLGVELNDDRYLLRLAAGARRQQFYFDGSRQLRRVLYLQGQEVQLIAEYDKLDETDGFPRQIALEMPQQQTRLTLRLSEVRLNTPIKAGRFQLSIPANALPLQLSGLNAAEEGL